MSGGCGCGGGNGGSGGCGSSAKAEALAPVVEPVVAAQFEALAVGLPWQRLEQMAVITHV